MGDTSFVVFPIRDHAFLSNQLSDKQQGLRQHFFEITSFLTQHYDFTGQSLLDGFEEVFRSFVLRAGRPLALAKFGD